MVLKKQFSASVGRVSSSSPNRVEGLALPFGVRASERHPSFEKGMLVHVPVARPLFLEHDHRMPIGIVETIYEKEDGVYFIATLTEKGEFPTQVSVGGEYILEDGKIVSLYIYEISLTSSPAYTETYTKLLANMQETVKFQEEELMQRLMLVEEQMSALSAQVQELDARVAALEQMQPSSSESASEQIAASIAELQKSFATIRSVLSSNTSKVSRVESALLEMQQSLQAEKKSLEEKIADFQNFVVASKEDFTELSAELVKLSENILKNIKV